MFPRSTRTIVTSLRHQRTPAFRPTRTAAVRQLHQTQQMSARKGSEDKDSINREPTEYTRSGTDEQVAQTEQAAFDPNATSPEAQQKQASAGSGGSPLDVSPANPNVSEPRPDDEGGAEHAPGERGTGSGGGSGKKNKSPS